MKVRPGYITSAERSMLTLKAIDTIVSHEDNEYYSMFELKAIHEAFALHDGPCVWGNISKLNDRQVRVL